jgi:hypothetical protein
MIVFVLLRLRWRPIGIGLVGLAFGAVVMAATVISVVNGPTTVSGNYFRVFAWLNAVERIAKRPVFGTAFEAGQIEVITEAEIEAFGVAEKTYLGLAMQYGVMAAVLQLAIAIRLMAFHVSRWSTGLQVSRIHLASAFLAAFAYAETFYGSFAGAPLVAMCIGLLCCSAIRGGRTNGYPSVGSTPPGLSGRPFHETQ